MGALGAGIIGGELGLFFAGLLYLIKGEMKYLDKKHSYSRILLKGTQFRLASLLFVLPLPLAILLALLTGSPQQSLLENLLLILDGTVGIILTATCAVIGMILMYTTPKIILP